jgi:class 3 adenylate cyclase
VERKLADVLAADVVGYSRLMEADKAGTLAARKERRKVILNPLVSLHTGRIVKVMGDGVLIELASAVNAVQCAVELQQKMADANEVLDDDHFCARTFMLTLPSTSADTPCRPCEPITMRSHWFAPPPR